MGTFASHVIEGENVKSKILSPLTAQLARASGLDRLELNPAISK